MGVVDRVADVSENPRALRELERRRDPAELETVDVLHDDDRRVRLVAVLEDLDDAPVLEEREGARLAQEVRQLHRARPVAADDLRRDEAVERQVAELEDLPHPARPETFERLKPFDRRHGPRRGVPGRHTRRRGAGVQLPGDCLIAPEQVGEGRDEVRAVAGDRRNVGRFAARVALDEVGEQAFEIVSHVNAARAEASAPPSPARTSSGTRRRSCRAAGRSRET